MKKLLSFLLALTLSLSLATFALADDDGGSSAQFDPEVTVEENGSTMTVTLSSEGANDEILASKRPTLTVACDYARAVVTDPNGVRIESTLSGGKISFTVTMGGKYTITRIGTSAPSPKPAEDDKTDEPQPDDGTYVNPYPDVQAGDWYSGAVQFVTEEKLMTGTGKGFEPNAATTRAMLWTILARMDGADTNSTGAWYAAARTARSRASSWQQCFTATQKSEEWSRRTRRRISARLPMEQTLVLTRPRRCVGQSQQAL